MNEKAEKKPRRTLTLADHVELLDAKIKASEERTKELRAKRDRLVADAKAKAEARLREAQAVAGNAVPF